MVEEISTQTEIIPEVKIVYMYKKYDCQKRAVKKYQEANKDKLKEYAKNKYHNNEEYREAVKRKSKERYYLKKGTNKPEEIQ
jgi:hypothetical protein